MAQLAKRRNERQDPANPATSPESIKSSPVRQSMAAKRLQPNEPLHMTTRAASLASSVAAGTTAPSAASNGSRRSSLGETTKSVGGDDLDSDRPAKMAKLSSTQNSIAVSQQSTPPQESNITSRTRASAISTNQNSADPGKSDDDDDEEEEEEPQDDGAVSDGQASQLWDDDENLDDADESPEENYTVQEVSRSNHNLRGGARSAALEQSLQISRVNSQNQAQNTQNNDRQSVEAEESGGILKRMPGRRRAPHPDVSIEVDLRRQLELKVAYRAVVKALKPILVELAERTKNELQAKDDTHKEFEEYEDVIAELDDRLAQRKQLLEAELEAEQARLERDYQARKAIANEKFDFFLRDRRDDYLLKCQNKCLDILDDAEKEYDSDATDYEDGVVPKLYHIGNDGSRTVLADGYESRSRVFVETAKKWDDTAARSDFRGQQQEFDPTSLAQKPTGFAVYDPKQRQVSRAYFDVRQLAEAAEHVESESKRATKRAQNEAATGLHALADATSIASPLSQDVKPNIHALRTPKTQFSGTVDNKNDSAGSAAKERSSRRQRQLQKPQPLFANAHEPYPPSGQTQPDYSKQYAPLPSTASNQIATAPTNAPVGMESGPPVPAWQYSAGLAEPRGEGSGAIPHMDHRNAELDNSASTRRTSAGDDFSRQAQRRRPGPRAFFANDDHSNTPQQGGAQPTWEPFTNTMGPPTYLPPYVKPTEGGRNASPTESPISPVMTGPAPTRSGTDWPGFSTSSTAGPGRIGGIDRPMTHSSFPLSGPPSTPSSSGRPPLGVEQLSGRRPASPDPYRPGDQSPRNSQAGPPQSYYPSPQSYSNFAPPNRYYDPYRPYSQAPGSSDRQGFTSPNSANLPPLLPHPMHLNNPPYPPHSQSPPQLPSIASTQLDASHEQAYRGPPQTHSRNSSQAQPPPPHSPYARTHSYSSQPHTTNPPPNLPQPHLSQPQAQTPTQQYANHSSHQRILPATLDPTRHSGPNSQNPSPSMRPANVTGTPTEADKHASAHTPASIGANQSLHSSPRTSVTSPSAAPPSASNSSSNAQNFSQHHGFLPPFSTTGPSYRPPRRHTPTSMNPNTTPGRPLQPTPPQAQQHPPPKPEQGSPPNAAPPGGQQYGTSPYATIAPAPTGPPGGPPPGHGPPLAPAPPMHGHMPPMPPHGYGPTPSTGETYPSRPYEQPYAGPEAGAWQDGQRSDKEKNPRGQREKEWKFTSSRWG